MAVTQKQIAAQLGVSQTLVGVALSGNGRIGDELRARIVAEATRLGYKPNRIARALKSGRSHLIALWLPRPLGDYDAQILEQLHGLAARDGFHLLTALAPRYSASPAEVLAELPLDEWPLDGVLALDSAATLSGAIRSLARARPALPLVAFGHRALLEEAPCDCIGLDLAPAAAQAVSHLLEAGCQRLAFVAARSQMRDDEPRLHSFRRVCREHKVEGREISVPDSVALRRVAQSEIAQIWRNGERFDGFFCGNDDVALGVLRALRRLSVSVPTQARVIGCDDIPDAADADPPLSTINLPLEELCERAWTQFRARLDHPQHAPHREFLTPQFVRRQSS